MKVGLFISCNTIHPPFVFMFEKWRCFLKGETNAAFGQLDLSRLASVLQQTARL